MSATAGPRLVVVHPSDLQGENAGLYWLHVTSLVELLSPAGWRVEAYSVLDPRFPAAALGADLVVLQMLAAPEAEGVILRRRDLGVPTVYEVTDNILGVGDWLPATHATRSPLARQGVLYHAWLADSTQMLVPALAELFAPVNQRAILLSPPTPFPDQMPEKPPGFVFGWSGSRSHSASLAAVAPAVVELCRRHPEATFAYMGNLKVFDQHFGAIAPEQRQVRPFGERDALMRFTAGLHVGIAPMIQSPFNATRSDTRVGIYAGHGVAMVLEDAPAHRRHHERARIFRTAAELFETLEELFHDRAQVEALARAGHAWMKRERSPAALAAERDGAYRALLAGAPNGRPVPVAVAEPEALSARLALAARQEPEDALSASRELVAEHPAYDQAHLVAARSLERLGRHAEALVYVEGLDPSPVYADLFAEVGARAAARVRPAERARHVAAIRSPFRRARLGEFASAAEQARAVLEHNPFDHFALASTIRRLERDDPDTPGLADLYERWCMIAPEGVPDDRRPAWLAPFLLA